MRFHCRWRVSNYYNIGFGVYWDGNQWRRGSIETTISYDGGGGYWDRIYKTDPKGVVQGNLAAQANSGCDTVVCFFGMGKATAFEDSGRSLNLICDTGASISCNIVEVAMQYLACSMLWATTKYLHYSSLVIGYRNGQRSNIKVEAMHLTTNHRSIHRKWQAYKCSGMCGELGTLLQDPPPVDALQYAYGWSSE